MNKPNSTPGANQASFFQRADRSVVINGTGLTINDTVAVARYAARVKVTTVSSVLERVRASHDYIVKAAREGKPIYGVTTGFGGMAHTLISPEEASELQENLIWFLKSEAGQPIPCSDVRAAMLIRANSHLFGFSGLRLELIERMVTFLNANVTPILREFGSIGASGDLIPLADIAGALIGQDKCYRVDFAGEIIDAPSALKRGPAATASVGQRGPGHGQRNLCHDRDCGQLHLRYEDFAGLEHGCPCLGDPSH